MRIYVRILAPLVLLSTFACDAQRAIAPLERSSHVAAPQGSDDDNRRDVLPLSRFVLDDGDGCPGPSYKAFDFWVGAWNASPTGTTDPGGTNLITKETDGCTIEEHWTDPAGVRGRSLNAYDASTGKWNQLWMDQSGGALIFDGTSGHRSMQLAGTHQTSRFDPTPLTDRATWTALPGNRVRQFGELSTNGGPFEPVYDITYQWVQAVTPIAPSALEFCASPLRPRFHAFDFLIGSWTVRAAGVTTPMQSEVRTDLGACLVEERMRGPRGYRAVAYSGFRSATFVWNWMYMDNRGVQLRLSGPATLTGTNMILSGQRTDRDGQVVDVRVEWVAIDATTVEQRWSFSTDGGTTWTTPEIVTMTR